MGLEFYFDGKCFADDKLPRDICNRAITESGKNTVNGIKDNKIIFDGNVRYDFVATGLEAQKNFTLIGVIKRNVSNPIYIGGFGNNQANKHRILALWNDGELCLENSSGASVRSGKYIDDKYFHHLAIVGEFDKPLKMYIDGELVFTTPNNYAYYMNDVLASGIQGTLGSDFDVTRKRAFEMKSFKIYSNAMTDGEILNEFRMSLPLNPDEIYLKDDVGSWNKCRF